MSNKKIFTKLAISAVISASILIPFKGKATVGGIFLTPANPTVLSNGRGYYLAGIQYIFRVQVIDPDATAWTNITNVRLVIPNTLNVDFQTGVLTGVIPAITVSSGNVSVTATALSGTFKNFFIDFTVTFLWNSPERTWASGNITAYASSNLPGANTLNTSVPVNYGICASVRALNLAMDGDAADGCVTRWHENFNVSADAIIYNVPGAGIADAVDAIDSGELTNVRLLFDANVSGSDLTYPAISINAADGFLSTLGYTFSTTPIAVRLRAVMNTGPANENCQNYLNLICNEIEIMDATDPFTFYDGGGVNTAPSYYRSLAIPGTKVRLYARMRGGSGPMNGTVTVTLRDTTNLTTTDITIPNGGNDATANLTYSGLTIAAGATGIRNYQIVNISGGAYGSNAGFGQNQTNAAFINQPAARSINWDNIDPPGNNAAIFNGGTLTSPSQSADSITLQWNPISSAFPDGDFYSYRIYYRTGTEPYKIVDRNSEPALNYSILGNSSTGTVILTGLSQFTNYDFFLSAVDVFGHEVSEPNRPTAMYATTASSTEISISDGITTYTPIDFASDPDPATIGLLESSIIVTAKIITGGNSPSSVSIIAADNSSDIQHAAGGNDDILSLPASQYYRIQMTKTAPNTWKGQIPTTNPLIKLGTSVRFIIETVYNGAPGYSDVDQEPVPPGDHQSHEWRFSITEIPDFTPWPVKILNNVITKKNPVAYPAYYLTADAYVTITVYDIKGRPISTLLERSFRKTGRNIKENGWRGTNKKGSKVAPGLYYIRIKAEAVSGGKTLINEVKKVVVSE
jgi:hypothetical protein